MTPLLPFRGFPDNTDSTKVITPLLRKQDAGLLEKEFTEKFMSPVSRNWVN